MRPSCKYRPEIDGLRAIAVVSVVLYHARLSIGGTDLFRGGFLGVDIFFVISGYLITRILLRELAQGSFSLVAFYERRARRILPALFAMISISTVIGWFYMLQRPLEEFFKSILASTFFVSNILFLTEDSYTAEPSTLKPLLHTWSLSVEEQYYLLFPLLLSVLWKWRKGRILAFFITTSLLSLAYSEWLSVSSPSAAFFLLPTRAWELFCGSILAVLEVKFPDRTETRWPSLLGISVICCSIFSISDQTPHLPALTVLPVFGTMLIIWFTAREGLATNLLTLKPMIGVGLISYSLYLWHQPIFAFARVIFIEVSAAATLGLVTLSFVLATLSWKLVETPFRTGTLPTRQLWAAIVGFMVVVMASSVLVFETNGYPRRLPPHYRLVGQLEDLTFLEQDGRLCSGRPAKQACIFKFDQEGRPWVLLGDSHGEVFSKGLKTILEKSEFASQMKILTVAGMPYAPGLYIWHDGNALHYNTDKRQDTREVLLKELNQVIVIAQRMPVYLSGKGFNNKEGGLESMEDHLLVSSPSGPSHSDPAIVRSKFVGSMKELLTNGNTVIIVYPVPEAGWNVPKTLIKMTPRSGESLDNWLTPHTLSTSYKVFRERTKLSYELYDAVGEHPNLIRIYPEKIFCNTFVPDRCVTMDSQHIFYNDDDHLDAAGAKLVLQELVGKFRSRISQNQARY
ncbi:MAG: acyltransferase family protein [Bdellovibrionales bacterium]